MNLILRTADNVAIYRGEELLLTGGGASGLGWADPTTTTANAVLVQGVENVPADWIGGAYSYAAGVWTVANPSLLPDPVAAAKAVEAATELEIQHRLDAVAVARGYGDANNPGKEMDRLISYVGSSNATWDAEAKKGFAMRDSVWIACAAYEAEVLAGTQPMPASVDAAMTALLAADPSLFTWPA